MIGVNCGGTLPPVPTMQMIRDVYELDPSDVIKEEIAKGKLIMETAEGEKGFGIEDLEEDGMGRRENCQRCDLKIPSNADLALGNWGGNRSFSREKLLLLKYSLIKVIFYDVD